VTAKLRATGRMVTKASDPGAQSPLRGLVRADICIGCIKDVTPSPTESTRRMPELLRQRDNIM